VYGKKQNINRAEKPLSGKLYTTVNVKRDDGGIPVE
jgi:hypothetical protein